MVARMKTEPDEGYSDLPELTPNQREFVRHLLAGKTASDAYRLAYSTENMQPQTIWVEASKLRANPNVALWLAAARKAHFGSAVLTKDDHMRELERLREVALEKGNIGAAVQAEQLRGKVAGHHVERIQDVTPISPQDTLREIAELDEGLAAKLAAEHGIEFSPGRATKH